MKNSDVSEEFVRGVDLNRRVPEFHAVLSVVAVEDGVELDAWDLYYSRLDLFSKIEAIYTSNSYSFFYVAAGGKGGRSFSVDKTYFLTAEALAEVGGGKLWDRIQKVRGDRLFYANEKSAAYIEGFDE